MSNYAKYYKDAVKSKKTVSVSTKLVKVTDPGTLFIGKLIEISTVTPKGTNGDGSKKNPYFNYHLETDDGTIKFSCGAVVDSDVKPLLETGKVYSFEYKGKQELNDGREMRVWEINEIPVPDDIPF